MIKDAKTIDISEDLNDQIIIRHLGKVLEADVVFTAVLSVAQPLKTSIKTSI